HALPGQKACRPYRPWSAAKRRPGLRKEGLAMDTSKGFGRMSGVEAQMRPERVGDASLIGPIRLFAGVIRRASQRAGLHMFEAHRHSDLAPAIEFRRRNETLNRKAARVRLQVLA